MTAPYPKALALAALILVLDQATKWLMMTHVVAGGRPVRVLPILDLVAAWNRGISFSLFHRLDARWALVGLSLAIVAGLMWWLGRLRRPVPVLAVGAVIGGALGNVVDRLWHGAVFDFLYFHWQDWYWPAFNLADSAVSVGVAALLLDGLFEGRKSYK